MNYWEMRDWAPGMRGRGKFGGSFRVVEIVQGFVMCAWEKHDQDNDGTYIREALEVEDEARPDLYDSATLALALNVLARRVGISVGPIPVWRRCRFISYVVEPERRSYAWCLGSTEHPPPQPLTTLNQWRSSESIGIMEDPSEALAQALVEVPSKR